MIDNEKMYVVRVFTAAHPDGTVVDHPPCGLGRGITLAKKSLGALAGFKAEVWVVSGSDITHAERQFPTRVYFRGGDGIREHVLRTSAEGLAYLNNPDGGPNASRELHPR